MWLRQLTYTNHCGSQLFDLFVYMLAVLVKLLLRSAAGILTCFSAPGLVVLRNPQTPQTLLLPRHWTTGNLCPLKTCTWTAKSLQQRKFGERPHQTAWCLLSGEIFQEIQRSKSPPKKTKAPKSPLCCRVFICSHQLVRMSPCLKVLRGSRTIHWMFKSLSAASPDWSCPSLSCCLQPSHCTLGPLVSSWVGWRERPLSCSQLQG